MGIECKQFAFALLAFDCELGVVIDMLYIGICSDLLDDSGRVPAHHHIVRDILCYNGSCADDGIPADCHTRADDGTDADPCILFYCHLSEMEQVVPVVKVMIYRCNLHLGAYQHVVLYLHLPGGEYGCPFVDCDVLPELYPASAIAVEW